MLQNAYFYLIKNISHTEGAFNTAATILPLTPNEVNTRGCKNLEYRLTEQFPHASRLLNVNVSGCWPGIPSHLPHAILQQKRVTIFGEILNQLHSIILYNATKARLKMKMSLELSVDVEVHEPFTINEKLTTILKCETELFPQGNIYYSSANSSSSVKAEIPDAVGRELVLPTKAKIRSLSVWVEGVDYDLSYASHPDLMVGQKRLLETGMCSDVKIITMDDSEIPCHKVVLIGQSPVLETMLKDKVYVEGQTGEISMMDRSKDEVMSFLAFLYCADLKKALTDTETAVTLSEMAHYYDVKGLENGIKPILLSRPAESFEVDAALRLFNIACGSNDLDLKRKAADVLETRANDELFNSPLLNGFPAAVVIELFAMSRRMQ